MVASVSAVGVLQEYRKHISDSSVIDHLFHILDQELVSNANVFSVVNHYYRSSIYYSGTSLNGHSL